MECKNVIHNLSWTVNGEVSPCNNLINFPKFYSVEQLRTSKEYDSLTNDHFQKKQSPYCQRCWDKELLGLTSKRQVDAKLHEVYSRIDIEYTKIDAALGDICNAACRICGPDSSTLWQQQNKKFFNIDVVRTPLQQTLWTEVNNNLNTILQLDFGGGEPWLNSVEEQEMLLTTLINQGRSKYIKLRYNTNGSLRPRVLLDKFSKFREVEITISLDDIEQRFEYNRFPLNWKTVEENVKFLIEFTKVHKNISLTINYTVSVFTFYYAEKFLNWANTIGISRVNWSLLDHPKIYNIKSLPTLAKESIIPTQLFAELVAQEPMDDWKNKFKQQTDILDKQRGEDFGLTFPELKFLL